MPVDPLLPDAKALRCEQITISPDLVCIQVASASPTASCPQCGRASFRVHSRYLRTLTDLPWHGRPVRLRWRSRRFFCDAPECPQQIFTERRSDITAHYSHKTTRLTQTLSWIGLACGGEGGARLAGRLGMTVSPDSLLRSIRRITLPQAAAPMVIGVDDWAIRRGQRYGTILCDLERHRPVELLPERSAESFKAWLLAHPGVQVISRDRGDDYRKGAAAGAPRATQVADRWHLMHNLHEALMRTAERLHREVDQAARAVAGALKTPPEKPSPASGSLAADPAIGKPSRAEQAKQIRQARRQERYEQVLKLHQQGLTRRAIAHQLDLARDTIRRWVRAGALPQRATRRYPHGTDAFVEHLRRRWQEGCHNAVTLTRELTSQGFGGSYYMVRRWVAMWRADDCDGNHSHTGRVPPDRPVFHRPSPKRVAWWLMKPASDLLDHEQALLTAVQERCPELKAAADLAREFADLLHKHQAQSLEAWIEKAHRPEAPVELRSFADGLKEDWAAVHAAFSLGWSNGQVEGQVNRLKLIKRQMYGRANFDLLRQRFLYAG